MEPTSSQAESGAGQSTQDKQQIAPSQKRGTKIEYTAFEDHEKYVTGIAPYSDPNGQGTFNVRVSGQREYVLAFAQTAEIVYLRLMPFAKADFMTFHEPDVEAAELRRRQLLAEPDEVWQLLREQERTASQAKPINFEVDRYIEIEPLDPREKGVSYYVSFYIDPQTVAPGFRDVYSNLGRMIRRGGTPISGQLRDGLASRGTVTASGGAIATYDYYGAWLIRNDESLTWWW